jgi:integrase
VASVIKRSTSKGIRYDVRYRTPSGTVRNKTLRTRRDAERFANTVEADLLRGHWVDPRAGRVSFGEYADEWLAHKTNLRPRTRELYAHQLRAHIFPTLGAVELAKLSPKTVREWHSGLTVGNGLGANTAAKCYRLLRSILATAVADELILRNPCVVRGAGVERTAERPVATAQQVWDVAERIGDRYRVLVLIAGFVGLRVGELLGLERRHVNLLHQTITVEQQEQQLAHGQLVLGPPKSDAGVRTLVLPTFLAKELEDHLERFTGPRPDDRVFPGEKGGPLRRHVLAKHWAQTRQPVGLPAGFRFHDLRHTANTITASAGASTRELMHRMGHASPEAALRYQHATRDRDAALAAALGDLVQDAKPVREAGSAR